MWVHTALEIFFKHGKELLIILKKNLKIVAHLVNIFLPEMVNIDECIHIAVWLWSVIGAVSVCL